jgi:tetratricopeptide (TPR) repeat protein
MLRMLNSLENNINQILLQENPSKTELRHLLLELDEMITSKDFISYSEEEKKHVQNLRKELRDRLRMIEEEDKTETGNNSIYPEAGSIPNNLASTPNSHEHDPRAETQMEEAERMFYSGRYAEALRVYDRVLEIEPGWERAKQHHLECENYLRTGYIPSVALPAEAASTYGKAQSAARVGRYSDALVMLQKAQNILREYGIQRWQEGQEFEQKLQENIDAELAYEDGINLLRDGRLDEAIERIETAGRATGLPKYHDKAQELRNLREKLHQITEIISAPDSQPTTIAQAKADLDFLAAQYGEIPVITRLQARMVAVIPRVVTPLKENIRSLMSQASSSPTIENVLFLAGQARQQLDQIRNLEGLDENLDRLEKEVDRTIHEAERCDHDLTLARSSYEAHKGWPTEAWRLSHEVRSRYPNDPKVASLSRNLLRYRINLLLLRSGIVIFTLVIISSVSYWAYNRFNTYQLSLTPTVTSTPTITATFTSTSTTTPTVTATSTPTVTFTPTPTPNSGVLLRSVWARANCYQTYNAIARLPEGGLVRFLPEERRFDDFNRECVLIEYIGLDRSVIGWVLIADLAAPTPTPHP